MRTEEQTRHHGRNVRRNWASRSVVFLSGLFCLAVVCAAVYAAPHVSDHREWTATAQSSDLVVEANVKTGTIDDPAGRQAELDEIVWKGLIISSINATPNLKTGDSEVNLLIEDPSDNGICLTVSIFRDDVGEKIYKPGYLNPEQYTDDTPFDVTLPKGEYLCTAYFNSYRVKDSSYLGRTVAKITVYVLN